ncbi:TPA: hypothetical protein VBA94_001899 [Streptococcus agalactiae]|nr:hypothetical protein [Streptococcus agalactiae]
MLLLSLSIIIYTLLTIFNINEFLSFNPLVFLSMVYILPVLINMSIVYFQKNKTFKILSAMILPTISSICYSIFAYITLTSGSWEKFVESNSIAKDGFSMEVSSSLFEVNQVVFMLVVYYGSTIIQYFMNKRVANNENGERRYA